VHQARDRLRVIETGEISLIPQTAFFLGDDNLPDVDDILPQFPFTGDGDIFIDPVPGDGFEVFQDILPVGKIKQQRPSGHQLTKCLDADLHVFIIN